MQAGLFRFNLSEGELPTKYLPGKHGFLLQLNPKRWSQKRPSEMKISESLTLPFDPTRFNFTRIDKREILLELVNADRSEQIEPASNQISVS
jgi:hypothetical protein